MKIHDCQQGSPAWVKCRLGIPTSSQFKRILTPKTRKYSETAATNYMHELCAEYLLGVPMDGASSGFMARGSELEAAAVRYYEFTTDTETTAAGFVTTDDGRAGCSPDRLVGTDGGLEIKILSAENHVAAMLGVHDDHWLQIQGCLWITGRKWWNRLFYHPTLPSVIHRIERDENGILCLSLAVSQFNLELEKMKADLVAMGCTPKLPEIQATPTLPPDAKCRARLPDGRWCMSRAGLVEVAGEWRCVNHMGATCESRSEPEMTPDEHDAYARELFPMPGE